MRKKELKEHRGTGESPVNLPQVSIEEDDASIGFSQETEDLEQPNEEEKQNEADLTVEAPKSSRKTDKKKLLNVNKFEKHLLKFTYCEDCDNL